MTRPSMFWRAAAAIFVFINVAGFGYAVAMDEPAHAAGHAAVLVATYLAWLLGPWRRRKEPARPELSDPRVEYLQQSVDAIALEVERLGEAHRFSEKLRAAQEQISALKKDE
ncbi:MAG: hypothetical protein ABR585_11175 [Gemmatimonadaceae bacterium]